MALITKTLHQTFFQGLLANVIRTFIFALGGLSAAVWAQSVPSDLVDVSIEDLFAANVVAEDSRDSARRRWHLA